MEWNNDIDSAPREAKIKRQAILKGGKTVTYDATEYTPVILASACGRVIRSYWIESEQRWAGFKKGEQPVAWISWPEHPNPSPKHD